VAFIHRPEYYGLTQLEDGTSTKNLAELIVAKHRNGATDTVKLKFINEFAQFSDYDELSNAVQGGGFSGDREFSSSLDGDFGGAAGGFGGGGDDFVIPPSPSAPDGSKSRGSSMSTYEESPF
jgi:replicative DNA helicase